MAWNELSNALSFKRARKPQYKTVFKPLRVLIEERDLISAAEVKELMRYCENRDEWLSILNKWRGYRFAHEGKYVLSINEIYNYAFCEWLSIYGIGERVVE